MLDRRFVRENPDAIRAMLAYRGVDVDVDRLVVTRALVDHAPTMRRSRHQAMGRVFPVLKRACHVTFDLDVPTSGEGR